MIAAHDKADITGAREINARLGPSYAVESGPTWVQSSAVKAALAALGQPAGPLRLPLPPLDDDVRAAVGQVLDQLGVQR
jgi:dihydrodipicolinate synthase/N-acetylneuraminate lyase